MKDLCAGPNQNGLSLLLDGSSNCSVWKNLLQEEHDINPENVVNLMPFLDVAIQNYCAGIGFFSNECSCLNMPVLAKQSCEAQDCGGSPEDCLGNHFMRSNQGLTSCNNNTCTTYSGSYVDISFPQCIPQVCWNQQCWNSNALLKTAQRDLQENCVPGICISIIGTSTITTPVADPSAFTPSSFIANCGSGAVDSYPIYIPTTWVTSVDNTAIIPTSIANGGNQGGLTLYYQSTTNFGGIDIGAEVPDQIYVASNGRTVFNIGFNQALLFFAWQRATSPDQSANVTITSIPECARVCTVPSFTIVAPTFYYSYYNNAKEQIFSFSPNLILSPPVGVQRRLPINPIVINKEIPRGVYILVSIASFFLFITWILYIVATQRALTVFNSLS